MKRQSFNNIFDVILLLLEKTVHTSDILDFIHLKKKNRTLNVFDIALKVQDGKK